MPQWLSATEVKEPGLLPLVVRHTDSTNGVSEGRSSNSKIELVGMTLKVYQRIGASGPERLAL